MTVVPARRSNVGRVVLAVILIAMGAGWVVSSFRAGKLVVDPEGVTMIVLTRPGDGEKDVLPNSFVSADLNSGHAIDPGTLSTKSVKLFRDRDNDPVAAAVNTSAAGDSIVLQPMQQLEPRTVYRFVVTRGVKDR